MNESGVVMTLENAGTFKHPPFDGEEIFRYAFARPEENVRVKSSSGFRGIPQARIMDRGKFVMISAGWAAKGISAFRFGLDCA